MIETLFWGAVVRSVEAIVNASPTILIGLLVAAYFQCVLGREQTFQLFGGRTWKQIPFAWGMGMLLPVCSLGAIPIMTELRRSKLIGGTILAFGLTAPLFNPVSVLYGLSLSHPHVIFTICLCSLLIVTILGWSWDRIFKNEFVEADSPAVLPYGTKRIVGVFVAMFRLAWSRDMLWMLVGVLGVGLLSCFLPANSLQTSAEHGDMMAPLRMASIALPAYVTPMDAMVQLSGMFQHGNSIAAAFTLLILGTGLNLGMVFWSWTAFGFKKTLVWIVMVFALVLIIGYAIDKPLYPKNVTPEGHTHAYDQFCRPFLGEETSSELWGRTRRMIFDGTQAYEGFSLGLLALVVVAGGVLRKFDRRLATESWLASGVTSPSIFGIKDVVLPKWSVAALGFGFLILVSFYGCFIYYPAPSELYPEITATNAETCTRAMSGDFDGALHWIPTYEDQLRKLKISKILRRMKSSDEAQATLAMLEAELEALEHAMDDRDSSAGLRLASNVSRLYSKYRKQSP
jgi:uncharacterized protein